MSKVLLFVILLGSMIGLVILLTTIILGVTCISYKKQKKKWNKELQSSPRFAEMVKQRDLCWEEYDRLSTEQLSVSKELEKLLNTNDFFMLPKHEKQKREKLAEPLQEKYLILKNATKKAYSKYESAHNKVYTYCRSRGLR